jgi:small subunit ribosomal protein S8
MSMTDPIADMLTRIRNGQMVGHPSVQMPRSKLRVALAGVLKKEGFLEGYVEDDAGVQGILKVFLKYDGAKQGVIRGIQRVSRPGRRVYVRRDDVPRIRSGLGIAILTTSRGLLTDGQARKQGLGGEVICKVW